MDYSERRCRFLGAAYAGYDGRCKLQQTSAFRSLLGRPCHLFPLLMASLVGTHYSIWLFEMEYSRWPRRTASRWGHFYFEPGPVARCRLNKSLISDCYPWPNRGNPPKPPRECETRRSQPGGFLHDAQFWNQTQLELTIPREIRGLERPDICRPATSRAGPRSHRPVTDLSSIRTKCGRRTFCIRTCERQSLSRNQ